VALDKALQVIAPDNLPGQISAAMGDLCNVLGAADMTPSDLVQLRAFYVDESTASSETVAKQMAHAMEPLSGPGPALTLVPVQALMSPDVLFEVEAIAMRSHNGQAMARTAAWDPSWHGPPAPFSHALRVGRDVLYQRRDSTKPRLYRSAQRPDWPITYRAAPS